MTAPALPAARMFHEVRDQDQARLDLDHLIRETHAVFDRSGVPVSPGRVIKLVRTYVRRVQGTGLERPAIDVTGGVDVAGVSLRVGARTPA